jgi:hypothetical protein
MILDTRIEPIELTDDELKAVAGGFSISNTNSVTTNSFNNLNGDVSLTNSSISNSTVNG